MSADAGPNGETLKATAPVLVEPIGGVEIDDTDPDFEFQHASAKYAGTPSFTYEFEVLNPDGSSFYKDTMSPDSGGSTRFEIPEELEFDTEYSWRVRARLGSLYGPWSTEEFKTFEQFTCSNLGVNPLGIIRCHRNRFPTTRHPNPVELAEMMRGIARDFNRVGVPEDHPWGVLIKTSGNNCGGISCDIICSGNGAVQDQYDVLQDENVAKWSGNEVWPMVPRICQTVR